jgi:uncharacterized protein
MRTKKVMISNISKMLLTSLIACIIASCTEEQFSASQTREFVIQSALNNTKYEIKVALPEHYNPSVEKYATLYVLDGVENFDFVANNCRKISNGYSVPNVLVVSIGYGNDRSDDYTPTKTNGSTGGGALFASFIKEELIPRIERDFGADTTRDSRIILGHSYGGLFGAYVLAARNNLFGNYILLSPSIWYDNEVSLILEKQNRIRNKNKHQLVFLGIGELENAGRMQAPFEAFYQILRDNYSNIHLSKNLEKNLDHVGSKNPNIIKGLTYYFKNR